ncbi:MAG: hypothetical protein HKP12_15675 [Gammaproteobacteria bacterium]|nr:hypothetical protein [Gammaproteobacteria bacterium]
MTVADKLYCGIDNDGYGGMTLIGTIIRDAWVFGILPEDETCENWTHSRLQIVHDRTKEEWDKYHCLVSNLPVDLKQRHARIYREAVEKARAMGWDPNRSLADSERFE